MDAPVVDRSRSPSVPSAAAPSLALRMCGLELASPIVLLSGCVGFGEEYTRVEGFSNRDAGAIVLKGTTREPRLGNAVAVVAYEAWRQGGFVGVTDS